MNWRAGVFFVMLAIFFGAYYHYTRPSICDYEGCDTPGVPYPDEKRMSYLNFCIESMVAEGSDTPIDEAADQCECVITGIEAHYSYYDFELITLRPPPEYLEVIKEITYDCLAKSDMKAKG